MKTVLSTDLLEESAQFAGFTRAVCSEIADLSTQQIDLGAYQALIRKQGVGELDLTYVDCDPVVIERSAQNIERDNESSYFVTLQRKGVGKIRQMGREVVLEPGDFTVVDSALPYLISFEGPVRRLVARFPRTEFVRRGCVSENYCGRAFRGTLGTSAIAAKLLKILAQDGDTVDASVGYSLSCAVLDAIVSSKSDDADLGGGTLNLSQSEILRRVRSFVLANISDPSLCTSSIAAQTGISVRYLHKLFSATGITLNRWIQEERLTRCHRLLLSEKHRNRSIQEIAFSNGFNDSGYFSHRFSRRFGISPKQARGINRTQ